ncbi:MAG: dTDP-4-dehydrorhamnose 3,5-epimerase family protein [Actinomycetota bacterium]
MIEGVTVKELPSELDKVGLTLDLWGDGNPPGLLRAASCRALFPGGLEAWVSRREAVERITCLEGTIKLVLCDRREGSPTRDEVVELFLGEYRFREVTVPPGVLRGWKAVGDRSALVFLALEGGSTDALCLTQEEAAVPYDWDIVMQ